MELELSREHSNRSSSTVPHSFLLSLRQHSSALNLVFVNDDNPAEFISKYARRTHVPFWAPQINPFAIRSLQFRSITIANMSALVRLGRSGPEQIRLKQKVVIGDDPSNIDLI